MFRLPLPTIKQLNQYYFLVEDMIKEALKESTLQIGFKNYLNDNKIYEIVTGQPLELIQFHKEAMDLLIPNFNDIEFKWYRDNLNKKNKSYAEQHLVKRYSVIGDLERVFDYKKFISGSKPISYEFAKRLGQNTCTYCNRLYAHTIIVKDKNTNRVNNAGRITRPDFDHWFPKSKYPLLALSFFNLIPSCGVCNSSIKGQVELNLKDHIHPYIHEDAQVFSFSYRLKDMHNNNVKIVCTEGSKIESTLKIFKIEEVYDAHSDLELKDLLELRYKYSENYIDILLNKTFNTLEINKLEVYRLAFGVEADENGFFKRPFSKFKKGILDELGVKL
jgi:hypothetical protein